MSKKILSTNGKILATLGAAAVIIVVVAGALFFTTPQVPYYKNWGKANQFNLQNQDNQTVTLDNFTGKVLVMAFMYTHCPDNPNGTPGECSTITLKMNTALQQLQKAGLSDSDFHFISISFDWRFDNASSMKAYGQDRAEGQFNYWSFLSGNETQVNNTITNYGIWASYDSTNVTTTTTDTTTNTTVTTNTTTIVPGEMSHSIDMWVADKNGDLRVLYTGTDWKASSLVQDVINLSKLPSS